MTESLFSPSWHRVAGLKPRLRRPVRIHRHRYRNRTWYVLHDPGSGRHHRFTPSAHRIIGLMDGVRSVQAIWDLANVHWGDAAPSQDEMIRLLGQLHQLDLLRCDMPPDSAELFRRYQIQQRSQRRQRWRNPLALRLPLGDPDALLEACLPLGRLVFTWLGGVIWLLVVVSAAVLAASHWPELSSNVVDRIVTPQNFLLLWLLYPLIKLLHEFGHGLAAKVWGGQVSELGIMFLALIPVPYVDVSSANAFPAKGQRMVVGAAGMMVELFIAALALVIWLNAEPGLVRALAYNALLIGAVSTLLFNANPLLRFDGYYILADLIEIPNLATRAQRYLGYLLQRYLFGVAEISSPAKALGERGWFIAYGSAALVYRVFIIAVILLLVAERFFIVGVILALWASIGLLLMPGWKQLAFLCTSPLLQRRRLRALLVSASVLLSGGAFIVFVPLPLSTQAQGVIWLPEHSQVRAETDGFLQRFLAAPGTQVQRGQPLLQLEDPLLHTQVRLLQGQRRELQAQYTAEWRSDRVQAKLIRKQIEAVEADLARAQERVGALTLHSPSTGLWVVPEAQDLPGRFIRQGELIAYVMGRSAITIRSVVPQTDMGLLRQGIEAIHIKLAETSAVTRSAAIARAVPKATDRLPSVVLGTRGGGVIPTDPSDGEGLTTLTPVFQIDLRLLDAAPLSRIGGRAFVRFYHGREPLAQRCYRRLRRLFLRRFEV